MKLYFSLIHLLLFGGVLQGTFFCSQLKFVFSSAWLFLPSAHNTTTFLHSQLFFRDKFSAGKFNSDLRGQKIK